MRPSFSTSSLSPCTRRSPRLTCVSELKAPPALAHRLMRPVVSLAYHDILLFVLDRWSGCEDLNLGPPGSEPGALVRLSYTPCCLVRVEGVEPPRPCGHHGLNVARMRFATPACIDWYALRESNARRRFWRPESWPLDEGRMVRPAGVEPASPGWRLGILPLNEGRLNWRARGDSNPRSLRGQRSALGLWATCAMEWPAAPSVTTAHAIGLIGRTRTVITAVTARRSALELRPTSRW